MVTVMLHSMGALTLLMVDDWYHYNIVMGVIVT
jgi:hypothetical protein